ncbi:MAG TPA: HD domain-containing phosphohydrolase [Solirubrobacteraceae bacterium]|nr:HD domain-containing phosphohydrolase [Solirubrobacteraceae bacterium]
MDDARPTQLSLHLAVLGCLGAAGWCALAADERISDPLTWLLAAGAVVANLLSVRFSDRMFVSASFTCTSVGFAVLGPSAAFLIAAAGELAAWPFARLRGYALAVNVLSAGLPALVAGTIFAAIGPSPDDPPVFMLALAAPAVLALVLSFMIVALFGAPTWRDGVAAWRHVPSPFAPALLWAVPVAAGVAYVSAHLQTLGLLALVLLLLGVTYMLQLVAAQRQARVDHSLAGHEVVAGMLRALRQRDEESARHAAAVAKWAQEIATAAELDEETVRNAHASGLLHDLGRLALSDVALGAEGTLSEAEWQAIKQHPHAGAEMLRNVGVEDAVADAVAAHHERPDGRGYPLGLAGDAIPELARIVAVAEVYDTLTAGTTYRPSMSSFQALTELRRVAGTQLDERYVEALANVLAHRPASERHATTVDLDAELAIKRRVVQATATAT